MTMRAQNKSKEQPSKCSALAKFNTVTSTVSDLAGYFAAEINTKLRNTTEAGNITEYGQ